VAQPGLLAWAQFHSPCPAAVVNGSYAVIAVRTLMRRDVQGGGLEVQGEGFREGDTGSPALANTRKLWEVRL